MKNFLKAIALATTMGSGLVSMTGCAADVAPDETESVSTAEQALFAHRGVLLIDRTGSMLQTRTSTGNSRCKDALTQAEEAVNEFFAPPTPSTGNSLAIWTFTNSSVTKVTGYVNKTSALNAVRNLSPTGCSGSTPLADSLCQATDELAALSPKPNALHVSTDGDENNSTGVCSGPWGDIFTPGTWQYKVRERVFNAGLKLSTRFWIAPTTLDLVPRIDVETGRPKPPGLPSTNISAICSTSAQCEHLLFSTLADDTGGTYGVVKDNNTQYPCQYGQCPVPDGGPIYW